MGAGAFDPDVINGVEYVPLPQVEQAIQAAVAERDARIKKLGEMLSEASRESIDRRARIKELEEAGNLMVEATEQETFPLSDDGGWGWCFSSPDANKFGATALNWKKVSGGHQ